MTYREIVSTGQAVRVDPVDRIPDYDPRSGEHLWVVTGAWQVNPQRWSSSDASITPMLDHENLLSVAGPAVPGRDADRLYPGHGCPACEPHRSATRGTGQPEGDLTCP